MKRTLLLRPSTAAGRRSTTKIGLAIATVMAATLIVLEANTSVGGAAGPATLPLFQVGDLQNSGALSVPKRNLGALPVFFPGGPHRPPAPQPPAKPLST